MPTSRAARLLGVGLSLASSLLVRCAPEPEIERRAVTLYAPRACSVDASAYAFFYASGDFQPTTEAPAYEGQFLSATGAELTQLPPSTRALVLDVAQGDFRWHGLAPLPPSGPVDALLWPAGASCALTGTTGPRTGGALVAFQGRYALVTGGTDAARAPRSWLVDLGTGALGELAADADLSMEREGASVTPHGEGVVVAGGIGGGSRAPSGSAERFVIGRGFDDARIELSEPRALHGAVTLVSGETLLVGGAGALDAGALPLNSLEVIDPQAGRARTTGLAKLERPRIAPTVVRLASGEVLVAGGAASVGGPRVDVLEWLAPDATSRARRSRDFLFPHGSALVPLPGGGALAVLALPPDTPSRQNVWVISADGNPDPAPPLEGEVTQPRLFSGAEGAPVLHAGGRWLRWEPWLGAFVPMPGAALATGPAPRRVDPADDGSRLQRTVTSPDDGLALWLDEDGSVHGLRFAVRGPFATEPRDRKLLVEGTRPFVPDRLVLPELTTSLRFERGRGLSLDVDATVYLADATFARFSLTAGVEPGRAPLVLLRDALGVAHAVGGPECPLRGAGDTIHVVRDAGGVRAGFAPDALERCEIPLAERARVQLGLRGGPDGSVVRAVELLRTP